MRNQKWRNIALLILDLAILLGALYIFEYYWLGFANFDINVPLLYGGDGLASLAGVKTFLTAGAFEKSSLLGAPGTTATASGLASGTNNIALLGNAFWSLFTKYPTVVLNLRIICIPVLNTLMAFYALRRLKLNHLVSCAGAFAFGTCYFVRARMGHIGLMFCGVIPLAVVLCIWCLQDDQLLRLKTLLTYKRNWLVVLFSILIANSGIAYYAFFTCFFLGITALYQLLNTDRRKNLLSTFLTIGCICFFFLLNFVLPAVINRFKGVDGGGSATMLRSFVESEIYGLRISALFLSPRGFGIPILQRAYTIYISTAYLINENASGYLGVFAIVGCLFLFLEMFIERNKNDLIRQSYLPLLSRMLVFAILFATIAGFSNLFAMLVTDLIRGYNRITIFLTFICILTVCYIAHILMAHKLKAIRIVTALAVILISLFSWYDLGFDTIVDTASITRDYQSDRRFIQQIDELMEDDAMIFQLPYATYPEQGYIERMPDYSHLIGYVHSDNLRWSYGSGRGSFNDEWYKSVASRSLPEMVEQLCFAGFSGIYIDTRGYNAANLETMTAELTELLHTDPLYDDQGLHLFFSMEGLKADYAATLSPETLAQAQEYALQGDHFIQYQKGFYPSENSPDGTFCWMKKKASMRIHSISDQSEYEFTFKLAAGVGDGTLTISCNNIQTTLNLTTTPQVFKVSLPLIEGDNVITLTYSGKQVLAPADIRAMFYRLYEFEDLNEFVSYQEQIEALIN